jgi:hypothetical protein
MEAQPATLSPADLQRFECDGYIVVRQAFPRAAALAMEARWWSELADTHGINRDDRSSWHQVPGNLVVDGVPLRVVELTGEPGDMVLCHPAMVHCRAPNRGTYPRFTRIKQQFLTREARAYLRDWLGG